MRSGKLKKVRILVLDSAVKELVDRLHELGSIHITKSNVPGLSEGRPLFTFDEVSSSLISLRGINSIIETSLAGSLPKISESELSFVPESLESAKTYILKDEIRPLASEIASLTEKRNLYLRYLASLRKLVSFGSVDFSKLNTSNLTYVVGSVRDFNKLESGLDELGETNLSVPPGEKVALIIYSKSKQDGVSALLSDCGFDAIEVPEITTTVPETIAYANLQVSEIDTVISQKKFDLLTLAKMNRLTVAKLIHSLEVETQRAEIGTHFSSSKKTYVIEGWVSEKSYSGLVSLINSRSEVAHLDEVHVDPHKDSPPVVLENPTLAKPFEFITRSYSLPNYFELDPTLPYFVALPIIYGLIVGDFVYGLMSLGLAWFLMNKFKKSEMMSNVSKIWFLSAFPAMLFGIIFDEYLGMPLNSLFALINKWLPLGLPEHVLYQGFHRVGGNNTVILLGATVIIGLLHLAIGFIFGAINEWNHNKKHAYAKLGWLGIILGIFLVIGSMTSVLSSEFTVIGGVLIALSIVVIAACEGLVGIVELPGLAGNILSYTRIAAVGVSGVLIAELVNHNFMPVPEAGLFNLLLIPVFVLLHFVNCFIAMFEGLVQSGRLNIVEFKSKFLHGGRELFAPFKMR